MSGHHRTTSDAPFKSRFAGGPIVARFGYWVHVYVNISNYFVFVEGGEQRGHPSLSYCKNYSNFQIKKGLPLISNSFSFMMHLTFVNLD